MNSMSHKNKYDPYFHSRTNGKNIYCKKQYENKFELQRHFNEGNREIFRTKEIKEKEKIDLLEKYLVKNLDLVIGPTRSCQNLCSYFNVCDGKWSEHILSRYEYWEHAANVNFGHSYWFDETITHDRPKGERIREDVRRDIESRFPIIKSLKKIDK